MVACERVERRRLPPPRARHVLLCAANECQLVPGPRLPLTDGEGQGQRAVTRTPRRGAGDEHAVHAQERERPAGALRGLRVGAVHRRDRLQHPRDAAGAPKRLRLTRGRRLCLSGRSRRGDGGGAEDGRDLERCGGAVCVRVQECDEQFGVALPKDAWEGAGQIVHNALILHGRARTDALSKTLPHQPSMHLLLAGEVRDRHHIPAAMARRHPRFLAAPVLPHLCQQAPGSEGAAHGEAAEGRVVLQLALVVHHVAQKLAPMHLCVRLDLPIAGDLPEPEVVAVAGR
mmetsp:Transcript_114646/g.309657  ORF Transcript_114646/g.309657 Transcript_114646/m.309657 type:complete len:287 (+) Transcript_114646:298-1158(+)